MIPERSGVEGSIWQIGQSSKITIEGRSEVEQRARTEKVERTNTSLVAKLMDGFKRAPVEPSTGAILAIEVGRYESSLSSKVSYNKRFCGIWSSREWMGRGLLLKMVGRTKGIQKPQVLLSRWYETVHEELGRKSPVLS